MSAIIREPPEEGSYTFVAVNNKIHAQGRDVYAWELIAYAERAYSRCIEAPWPPFVHTHMLFIRTQPAMDRAVALGWQDCTKAWMEHVEATRSEPTTPGQKGIYDALTGEWQSKADILQSSGVPDSEWRTAIKTLVERGLVEVTGRTNRTYKYKRTNT